MSHLAKFQGSPYYLDPDHDRRLAVDKRAWSGRRDSNPRRLTWGEGGGESMGLVPVSSEAVAEADLDDLVGDRFPNVREGIAVRALLKYEDLMLIRRIFVWYARNNRSSNDAVRARELMKRMLRKGGSEFYSRK